MTSWTTRLGTSSSPLEVDTVVLYRYRGYRTEDPAGQLCNNLKISSK